jgi:predicted esterase YcpF (UPF0227 family)
MEFDPNREKNIDKKENIYASVEYAVNYADIHDLSAVHFRGNSLCVPLLKLNENM